MSAGGFVEAPVDLLLDAHLSDGAFRAYLALASYARGCRAETFELTCSTLGTLLHCSPKTANRYLRELDGRRWILFEWRPGRPSLITLAGS